MVPHRRLSIANGLFETQTVQIPDWRTFSEKPFKLKVSMESVELTLEFYHGTFGSEFRRTRQGLGIVWYAVQHQKKPSDRNDDTNFGFCTSESEVQGLNFRPSTTD